MGKKVYQYLVQILIQVADICHLLESEVGAEWQKKYIQVLMTHFHTSYLARGGIVIVPMMLRQICGLVVYQEEYPIDATGHIM